MKTKQTARTSRISNPGASGPSSLDGTSPRKRAPGIASGPPPSGGARQGDPSPIEIFEAIAHDVVAQICRGSALKKKDLLHQAFEEAERQWEQKLLSKGDFRGKKALRRATYEMIDATLRCYRTAQKKICPRKGKRPKDI